jgi:hypothetical protein
LIVNGWVKLIFGCRGQGKKQSLPWLTPQVGLGIVDREGINNLGFGVLKAKEEDAHCLRLGAEGANYHVKGIPDLMIDSLKHIPDGMGVVSRCVS